MLRRRDFLTGAAVIATVAGVREASALSSAVQQTLLGEAGIPPWAPAPAQAAAVGFNSLTFNSWFTAQSLDAAQSGVSGKQWYPWNFFAQSTNLSGIHLNGDHTVTLTTGPNTQIATAFDKGSGNFVGTAFSGGFYIEAILHFNPQDVINGSFSAWPSFWMMSIEHLVAMAAQQWPGQAAGYNHFAEVDVLEYDLSTFVPSQGTNFYGVGWHDWFGTGNGAAPAPNSPTFSQVLAAISPSNVDFTQYHKYGCLWVPATVSTRGYLNFYFDNVLVGRSMSWSQYTGTPNPPSATAVAAFGHTSDDYGWQYNNLRQVLAPSLLGASSGGKIILQFTPGSCAPGAIDSCWIGLSANQAGTTNEFNFDGNQVQVTFNGSASFALGNNAVGQHPDITSDAIPFTWDNTKKLVIAMHFSGTDVEFSQQASVTGATQYTSVAVHTSNGNHQADTSSQTTATMGASQASVCSAIRNIYVQDTSPLSIIDQQHLVPIFGTGPNMPMTVQAMRVWQASAAGNLTAKNPAPSGATGISHRIARCHALARNFSADVDVVTAIVVWVCVISL